MPELPEVEALAAFLRERAVGQAVVGVELGSISVLKTFNPPPSALVGAPVEAVSRRGKFIGIDCGGTYLVFHLARAGWLRWSEQLAATVIRPGKYIKRINKKSAVYKFNIRQSIYFHTH